MFRADILPGLESFPGRGDGLVGQLCCAVMNAPYHLREFRRVEGIAQIAGRVALAADDNRIFAAELRFDLLQGFEHVLSVALIGKVRERFVFERSQIDHLQNPLCCEFLFEYVCSPEIYQSRSSRSSSAIVAPNPPASGGAS